MLDKNVSSEFFDMEWMFGIHDGFDVVIGNPPWGAKLNDFEKKILSSLYKIIPTKTKDSYLYFLIRSIQFLDKNSFLSLIIPNTWLLINNTDKLRKSFLEYKILEIDDYGDGLFSSATVESSNIFMSNKKDFSHKVKVKRFKNLNLESFDIIDKSFWLKDDLCRILLDLSEKSKSILNKTSINTEYFSVNNDIIWGIKPYQVGYGKPPQSQEDVKNRIFHSNSKKDDFYSPLLVGSNVNRYFIRYEKIEYIKYGEWLMYPSNFNKMNNEKILLRQTSDILRACFDDSKFLAQNSLFIISSRKYNLKILTSLLNSKLLNFIYKVKNPQKGKVFAEIKPSVVKELPIKDIPLEQQQPFVNLVDQIMEKKKINEDTQELEDKIDLMVYKLYELTYDEVKIVDPEFKLSEYDYNSFIFN